MAAPRHLVPVLATLALAVPAVPAHAQGAGDDQYSDPFAGSGSGSSSGRHRQTSTTAQRQSSPGSTQPGLSSKPPVRPSQPTSPTTTTPTTTTPAPAAPVAPAAAAPARALPRTGSDVPGMAVLGAGLLLAGIGLRLRTADESLY